MFHLDYPLFIGTFLFSFMLPVAAGDTGASVGRGMRVEHLSV